MIGGNITIRNSAVGSALILVVLLTSILAIIGALFVMSSRIDQMSTESIRQEKDLDAAVASIITKLANELVLDTPGIGGQPDYYDYPGEEDRWLASMEPYDDDGDWTMGSRYWGQISDLTGYLHSRGWDTQDIELTTSGSDDLLRAVVPENRAIQLDRNGRIDGGDPNQGQLADADGDGVADSKWIELDDVSSSTGQSVYAAIRVIDNGGMLNISTAYEFDPCESDPCSIDGSRLAQIDLMNIEKNTDNPVRIHEKRCNDESPLPELVEFNGECAIRLANPDRDRVSYLPYEISDELDLRNRFVLDANDNSCRIEQAVPRSLKFKGYFNSHTRCVPIDTDDEFDSNSNDWTDLVNRKMLTATDDNYDLRHILTAFNADRIIAPPNDVNSTGPATMINVNMDPNMSDSLAEAKKLYEAFVQAIDPNVSDPVRKRMKREFAQLAVNLVDLRDKDIEVTSLNLFIDDVGPFVNDFLGDEYIYGIEPFPVITQVAIKIDANDPCHNTNYYAVELFNPFEDQLDLAKEDFELIITDVNENYDPCDPNTFESRLLAQIVLNAVMDEDDFHVVYNDNSDPCFNSLIAGSSQLAPELVLSGEYSVTEDPTGRVRWIVDDPCAVNAYNVAVIRSVNVREINMVDPNYTVEKNRYVYLDRQLIPLELVRWRSDPNLQTRFYGRRFGIDLPDIDWWDVVYPMAGRQDKDPCLVGPFILGASTEYINYPIDPNLRPTIDIAVPYGPEKDLVTIGDIARIWTIGPTDRLYDPCDANSYEQSYIFDVNVLDVDPNEPNDPNGRLLNFNQYRRSMGETLRFVSISKDAGYPEDEDLIRLNLGDPYNANIFNYITVFDPRVDGVDNDGDGSGEDEIDENEKKINGRININTAPRFVLEQLPWMTPDIAEAIVAYRDKLYISGGLDYSDRYNAIRTELEKTYNKQDLDEYILDKWGFSSIGELNLVMDRNDGDEYSIRHYALQGGELLPPVYPFYPDLTDAYGYDDRADDDFEERDLVFARISNLVTVRSDIFTAYILVRLGVDGSQKRVIAILDRSDVYKSTDKVKVIAIHPVPDPR